METFFETNNLILEVCPPSKANLVADFYQRNFQDFSKYEPLSPEATTIALHKQTLAYEMKLFKAKKFLRVHIFEKNNPLVVLGTVSYRDISYGYSRKATLGYKMDMACRRRGYCFEAISKLNEVMFNDLRLNRIEATVLPSNVPSIRLLEKLGFKNEGLLRELAFINGAWQDHFLFSLLRREA